MSAVWKKVRKLSGKYSPDPAPVLRVAGIDIANPLDVANEIGNHLVCISQGLHLCPSFLSSKSARELAPLDFSSLREEQYNVPFTVSLQHAVDRVSNWATTRGFKFSSTKTHQITFTRRSVISDHPLYLYGSRIPERDTVKFLGLLFDRRLSWKPHITSLKATCHSRLNLLKTLAHLSWGADCRTLLRLHSTLILSKLDYGDQIYSAASPATLSSLNPIHHQGLRLCLGAFRSSPVESLYAEANVPSLSDRRDAHCLRYYVRSHDLRNPSIYRMVTDISRHSLFVRRSCLLRPFSLRLHSLLSSLQLPPFYVHVASHFSLPPGKFQLFESVLSPSLARKPNCLRSLPALFFLTTFTLILMPLLCTQMALSLLTA
nr:uncharacterized protein LOC128685670 [Cherax quadricarinatus]